ncbi:MAG: DUF5131 family protein [Caulobacteraceae bacterium]
MADTTHISWADGTWSPWTGCTKISPACDGCYAAHLMDTRMSRVEWGEPGAGEGTRSLMSESYWRKPLTWNRKGIVVDGQVIANPWIFPSLCDPFDTAVPAEWRRRYVQLMWDTPNVVWLLLTKRPGNILKLTDPARGELTLPPNAAIGCTVVTQEEADRDVPKLLAAKAALNPAFAFLSMEPLLGPVDLDEAWHGETALDAECWGECAWCSKGYPALHNCQRGQGRWEDGRSGIDWVITGGETDQGEHKARPSHPDWFRLLRDQCAAAGVPFHFKQWGEWAACEASDGDWPIHEGNFTRLEMDGKPGPTGWPMQRIGKKASGRALDGAIHDARPTPHPHQDPSHAD